MRVAMTFTRAAIKAILAGCAITPAVGYAAPAPAVAAGFNKLIFYDNFARTDISYDGKGSHKWYTGLWYKAPPPVDRIRQMSGFLRLTSLDGTQRGLGAELHTLARSPSGTSTTFHFGYFEARLRASGDPRHWGSFWLDSEAHARRTSKALGERNCEIDIAEFGIRRNAYATSVHDWRDRKSAQTPWPPTRNLSSKADVSKWNVYGMLWTRDRINFYFNNELVASVETPGICKTDRQFLIFSAAKNFGIDKQILDIDWVKVYR